MLAVSACSAERQYVRLQTDGGPGVATPVEHVVELVVDARARTVTWTHVSRDARGVESREVVAYGGRMGSNCDMADEANWVCSVFDINGELVEQPEMRDGHLTRYRDDKMESYQSQTRIWGVRF